MNEIEYAIANLEDFLSADIGQGDLHMCSAETALAALKEQQEREKGCFWCMSGISLSDVKINGAAVYISCCPMCGRKLGEWNG